MLLTSCYSSKESLKYWKGLNENYLVQYWGEPTKIVNNYEIGN